MRAESEEQSLSIPRVRTRLRVLPALSKRGLSLLCAGLGLAHGVVGAWLLAWNFLRLAVPTSYGFLTVFLVIAALLLVPGWAFGRLIYRVHPSVGRLLGCAALYGAAFEAGVLAVVIVNRPEILLAPWQADLMTGGPGVFIGMLLGTIIWLVVADIVFLVVFACSAVFERLFGKRVVRQTGLVCWTCAYNLGSTAITTCPECGNPFDPAAGPKALSPGVLGWLVRARWGIAGIALLAACLPLVFVVATHTVPAARFLMACPPAPRASLQSTSMMMHWVPSRHAALSSGWWIADPGSKSTGVVVEYVPRADEEETSIFVSRACLVDCSRTFSSSTAVPAGFQWMVVGPGTVRVSAHLKAEQARRVIASRSVPADLLRALRSKADEMGWKETNPMSPTLSKNSGYSEQLVDAEPFFSTQENRP